MNKMQVYLMNKMQIYFFGDYFADLLSFLKHFK